MAPNHTSRHMFLLRLIVTALAVMAGAGMPASTVRAQDAADLPQIFVNPGMRGQMVSAGTLRQLQILTRVLSPSRQAR